MLSWPDPNWSDAQLCPKTPGTAHAVSTAAMNSLDDSLLTSLIYPCHSAGGTVRAFTGVSPPRAARLVSPTATMPSADSHIRDGLPLRFAHLVQ